MSSQSMPATISFPLTGLRPLYSSNRGKKLVIEVDVSYMKKVNDPNTIDEMVAEAKLEHVMGRSKTFTSSDELIKELRS